MDSFQKTGLSQTLATTLAVLENVPRKVVLSALCLLASFMSEVASNSAVSALMIPVVIELARPGILMNLMTVAGEIISVLVVGEYLLDLSVVPWWAKESAGAIVIGNKNRSLGARRAVAAWTTRTPAPFLPHP
ncbi:hypothetical protein V5799_007624 [Amblyomma americanum]|uniref:Na+/dicarboxylate na+/tricarboxylate and phosphate transporter n=1 Tax=Amblyomma americanum TaxID=6943 RepID=A0AAQ4FH86_AMBAM